MRGKQLISCRQTLYWLLFTGWIVNFMLKMSLNLAIVSMVVPRIKEPIQAQCSNYVKDNKEFNDDDDINVTFINRTFNVTQYDIETILAALPSNIMDEGRFNWTEYEQGLALGSFFWSYWFTPVPGGILMNIYGTKKTFGCSVLSASALILLSPVVVKYHLYAFLALRFLQGFVMGLGVACMNIVAKWVPPQESSRFFSCSMGGSLGTALTYLLMGTIIDQFGWEAAFYTPSIVGIIWSCFWAYYAYDSPHEHPRIRKSEFTYITENISNTSSTKVQAKIPWRKILTSKPVWAAAVGTFGCSWAFWTLVVQAPTYISLVHGWDISMTGVLSGIPHILLLIFSFFFGALCDWLLKTNKMSLTAVRKFSVLSCYITQAIFIIGLSFSGCHSNHAITLMVIGTMMTGGLSSGALINVIDLSPNYSSVLLGISALVSNVSGALSPLIIGILTNDNQTIGQWRLVFLIAAGCLIGSAIIFGICGTAVVQPWNHPEGSNDDKRDEEMQKLNSEDKLNIAIDVKRKKEDAHEEFKKCEFY